MNNREPVKSDFDGVAFFVGLARLRQLGRRDIIKGQPQLTAMPTKKTIDVNISIIEYAGLTELAIACPVSSPTEVLVTLPTIEKLLQLRANSSREKLESKALEALLQSASNLGKNTKAATVFVKVQMCPDGFDLPKSRILSAVPYDVFVVLVQAESRKNDAAFNLLVAGFADSFLSVAREQIKQAMPLSDRLALLASWKDVLQSLKTMCPYELEDLIESQQLYPEPSLEGRMRHVKALKGNDLSIGALEALGGSGYLAAFLQAKFNPAIATEERLANLAEMTDALA